MTIKTKFNVGDEIFYLGDNQVKTTIIISIYTHSWYVEKEDRVFTTIKYDFEDIDKRYEDEIFATKQDLLNSL